MCTRLSYLISFVFVLSLVANVQAQTATWTDATGDHLWSTPDNWSEFPTLDHWAKVRGGAPGATIANEGAEASKVSIGYEPESALTVHGGSLTVNDVQVGRNSAHGTLNMIDGTITIGRDLDVGYTGSGTVNMTGGTIIVNRDLTIPDDNAHTAHVNLHGGTIIVNDDFVMGEVGGTMDITAGTLIIDGNAVSAVQGYIDSGWITPYDANGTVQLDYDVSNEGQTTVKAIHKLNPNPADGGNAFPGTITLEWTVDAGTPVDVWFGTSSDWNTWEQLVDKKAVTSVSVTAEAKQRYFWAVDTYAPGVEDPNYGPIFSFLADNVPPIVDAADDVTTWLEDGSREVAISATVDDSDPTTTLWTVVSEPNEGTAVIADAAQLDTTVTLTETGAYVLQIEASDGEYTGSDTVTITVFADSCLAAQSSPEFEFIVGDLNHDCIVDDLDMELLQENWLECNALDCPDPNAL